VARSHRYASAGGWAVLAFVTLVGCGSSEAPVDVENEPAPLWQGTVDDAVMNSCSTGAVLGLSNQIVAQVNCLRPNTLAAIPMRPNMTRSANTFAFMQPPARDALVRALDGNTGMTLGVNSMLRTVAQQFLLYSWYRAGRCSISLAAVPGGSNHESGLALDTSQYAAWQTALEAQTFSWLGTSDPVHFDYEGTGTVDLRPIGVRSFQTLWNLNNPSDTIVVDGIYGPATESRLRSSPTDGFAIPVPCGTAPDGGGPDAAGAADAGLPRTDAARSESGTTDALGEVMTDSGGGPPPNDARTPDVRETDPDSGRAGDSDGSPDARPPDIEPDGGGGGGGRAVTPEVMTGAGCSCRMVHPPRLLSSPPSAGAWGLVGATSFLRFRRRRERYGSGCSRVR